jgi:hypothetical protein
MVDITNLADAISWMTDASANDKITKKNVM